MKKISIFLLALFLGMSQMQADEFTVSDITVPQGGTATLEIGLNNPENACLGFQFLMSFPEAGITVSNPVRSDRVSADYNLQGSTKEEGYQILAYIVGTTTLTGTSGTVVSVTLSADASLPVGTTLTGMLTTCKMSDAGGTSILLDDVPFTVTIGEPDDGRVHFTETSTTLPSYTAGTKGNVTVERTIKTGQWSTLVLPFNLTKATATSLFGSDVQFAKFDGFEVDYGDDEENVTPLGITLKFASYTIPARGNLAGGTPVLIKVNTSQDITTIEADNVTLANVVKDEEKTFNLEVPGDDPYPMQGKFTATMVKTKVPADGLFISDNRFWYSTGKTNIKAFRGWFELDAVIGQETDFGSKIRFEIDDVPTSIEGFTANMSDGAVYSVQGMLIGKDVDIDRLPKGIYIVNGKKVFKNK